MEAKTNLTWFFSMRVVHLGQRLVLAKIQLALFREREINTNKTHQE
jgi:hypothetical protein